MSKKYISRINKGGSDIYIKDTEARDSLGIDTSVEYVDLDLPSKTLWAKCNIGAASEMAYGNYYMYGKGDRQYNSEDAAYTGTENPLDPTKDTATVVLGAPWHMPTNTQYNELVANTVYSWEENFNNSGINGGKFTATNGNYVFFPAAGYWQNGIQDRIGDYCGCWTSTPHGTYARQILLGSEGAYTNASNKRTLGISIRPVCDSAPLGKLSDKADKNKIMYDEIYVGAFLTVSSPTVSLTKYTDLYKGRPISVTAANKYLYVFTYGGEVPQPYMGGVEIPMALNTTINGGYLYKSLNTYNGTFKIIFL